MRDEKVGSVSSVVEFVGCAKVEIKACVVKWLELCGGARPCGWSFLFYRAPLSLHSLPFVA